MLGVRSALNMGDNAGSTITAATVSDYRSAHRWVRNALYSAEEDGSNLPPGSMMRQNNPDLGGSVQAVQSRWSRADRRIRLKLGRCQNSWNSRSLMSDATSYNSPSVQISGLGASPASTAA